MSVQTGLRPHDPFAYEASVVNYAAGVLLSIKQAPDAPCSPRVEVSKTIMPSTAFARKPKASRKRKHAHICTDAAENQKRQKRTCVLKPEILPGIIPESCPTVEPMELEEEHSTDSDNSGDYVPKECQTVGKRPNKGLSASSGNSNQNNHYIETKEVLVPEDIKLFLGKSREPVLEALLMCIVYGLACRQLADNRYLIEDHDLLHDYISLFAGSKANQTNSRVNRNKTLKSRWFKMPSGRKPKSFVIETYPERVKDVERKKREVTRKVGDKCNPKRIKVAGEWKTFTPPTPDQLRNILQRNTRINVKVVSSA